MQPKPFLPSRWSVEGLTVIDVGQDQVELVAELHRSRSEVGPVDHSFVPVEMEEYAGLVADSLANESDGKPFRLQVMHDESMTPCGYFHAYGDHPWDGVFFISMFFVVPGHARQGVGRRTVKGIVEQATALGFERILLNVFLQNRNALTFWIDQGFDRIEKYRRTEDTGQPDRFILELRLQDLR